MRQRADLIVAAAVLVVLAALAWDVAQPPRRDIIDAVPGTMWALACASALFGVTGLPLTRLLLPASLRGQEWLWVLPIGACASGLALTLLGFAGLPMVVSLPLVLVLGAAASVREVRGRGWPAPPTRQTLWVLFLASVVAALVLMPMLLRLHHLAPTGTGSDAHVAAGAANFLQHSYPTHTAAEQPIDRMPALWRSKFPIYYAFGGVAQLSGLASWQVMVPLTALLLALTAAGFFLVAREVLGAAPALAIAAAGLAGTNRMALHTTLNPYFNQLWGYFAVPFALVLAWCLFRAGEPRADRWRAGALLAFFALILLLAYPLAIPVVALPVLVIYVVDHRRRRARGEPVVGLRDLVRRHKWRKRDAIWLVVGFFLVQPMIQGVHEKFAGALKVLGDPENQLIQWAGDLQAFIPDEHFYSLPDNALGRLLTLAIVVLAVVSLWRLPRPLGWGLGALIAFGLVFANYFRQFEYGFYFHFKVLAFVTPIIVLIAVVGSGRWRRFAPLLVAVLALMAAGSVRDELRETGLQLGRPTIDLREWAAALPPGASVRLDMTGPQQLWGNYFLASRPTCSQTPLLETDYPHVPRSRKADFIVVTRDRPDPADAIGPPLRVNQGYELYRMDPAVPGPDRCSQRQQSRVAED